MGGARVAGRRALITGASRNIGRAIALDLARGGAAVAIVARRDRVGLEAVAATVAAFGGTAVSLLADVADEGAVADMVAEAADRMGGIDILVNNAAVRTESTVREPHADAMAGGDVDCAGRRLPVAAARACRISRRVRRCIINIGGLTAYTGAPNRAMSSRPRPGSTG